ncbi:DNA polymerase III subunit beta [bacterium]|nr:DNA polymerase III subunit beta [bacterium]
MNFITTREYLLRTIALTERVVGKKESLPVLSCFSITIENECVVRATNLESGVQVVVPGEIKEKGVIAVPAALFSSVVRSLSSDPITLRSEGDNLLVEAKGSKTLVKCVPHEEFPVFSMAQGETEVLPRVELIKAIQSVLYAASPSMIRPELGSVLVRCDEGELISAATDSFRLAEKRIRGLTGGSIELLIPLKHAQELLHILEKISGDTLSIAISDSQLVVKVEAVIFFSRITEGSFPQYTEVIPKQFSTEAIVLKSDLSDTLKKARLFSGTDHHIGFHLYPKRKIFSATAQSPNVGEMSEVLEGSITGEDLDINFHLGYLGDCLASIPSDSVTLQFAGVGRPLVMRGVSDTTFTYLVMPLNR